MGRNDERVGVAMGAPCHCAMPADASALERARVHPRRHIMHRDHGLLVGVDPVVLGQRSKQTRRMDHAGQAGEAVRPCGCQLTAGQAALEQRHAREAIEEVNVLRLGRRRHDSLDAAPRRRCRDEGASQVLGVARDAVGHGGQYLVDNHSERNHAFSNAPVAKASSSASRQSRIGARPAAAQASCPRTE